MLPQGFNREKKEKKKPENCISVTAEGGWGVFALLHLFLSQNKAACISPFRAVNAITISAPGSGHDEGSTNEK